MSFSINQEYISANVADTLQSKPSGAIAIGLNAGGENLNTISIGNQSNKQNLVSQGISIGFQAGQNQIKPTPPIFQGDPGGISIGTYAGYTGQVDGAIAIGTNSGYTNQGYKAIAIGYNSAFTGQKERAIAIGSQAGMANQGNFAVALGVDCGRFDSGDNAIAIGFTSGRNSQGTNAIAIGYQAGRNSQGTNCIAIGNLAGQTMQHANSIILNASGSVLNSGTQSAFYVNPIRSDTVTGVVSYNPLTKEVTYDGAKSFIIDHPIDSNRYLVHACLEGPEAGVYYRGKSEITNDESVEIVLPEYTKTFSEFTVQITPILSRNDIYVSEVVDGKFTVYGKNGKFFWMVNALRNSIVTEPLKIETEVRGDGPYKYIVN